MPTQGADNAAIIAGWQEFWRVYEKYAADPHGHTDFSETQYVTSGEEARIILDRIGLLRDNDWRDLGGREFRDVKVGKIVTDADHDRTAWITYCLDSLTLDVIDANGQPIEREGVIFREKALLTEGVDGIWRVTTVRNEPAKC